MTNKIKKVQVKDLRKWRNYGPWSATVQFSTEYILVLAVILERYNEFNKTMEYQEKNISKRKIDIANQFLSVLDKHLTELKTGQVEKSLELNEIAELLFIAPNHMSDTVSEVFGKSPCEIYENKLLEISKEMLENSTKPINEIARILDYDPSNFTKFFKHFTGLTPSQYRKSKTGNITI